MVEKPLDYCFDTASGILSLKRGGDLTLIRWTPEPRAEQHIQTQPARECWPIQRLIIPAGAETVDSRISLLSPTSKHALADFRQLIPHELAAFVEPFHYRQWNLLTLLHDVPDVLAWGVENPVLAYCAANNAEFRGIGEQAASFESRRHCMEKQKAILKWLKFPTSAAMVKLLKKVIPEAAEPWVLRQLRAAISSDARTMEILSHHTRINLGMIALLVHKDLRTLVTRELLAEVNATEGERANAPTADLLGEALHTMSQLPKHSEPRPFLSHAAVKQFHDEMQAALEAQVQRRKMLAKKRNAFPAPPIPGTKSIVPITSVADLRLEGNEMGHCIATYATRIKKGEAYAYRMFAPERATLLLTRNANGRWYRSEFRLRFNARPGKTAGLLVHEWLAKNQKGMMQ